MNFQDEKWVKEICKIGQGALCCRYITMGAKGWGCEKHSSLGSYLDNRVALEQIVARGDNCEGKIS